jgi:hypothetical protein
MDHAKARSVVAALFAYFPRAKEPEEVTLQAWAYALAEYEVVDALAAANELGRSSRFFPSLAELLDATRRARTERIGYERPELPSSEPKPYPFALFLAEHPDIVPRVLALQGSLMGEVVAGLLARELGKAA